jgi:PAS domain S-box-containing protein
MDRGDVERGTRWTRSAAWGAFVALLYFLGARLGLQTVVHPEGIAILWPASGVLLGCLLVTPMRAWPWVLAPVAAVLYLANASSGNPPLLSLGLTLANLAESTLAAALVLRLRRRVPRMDDLADVFVLVVVAVLVVDPATALVGAGAVHWGASAPFWDAWRMWVISNGLGMLVVTPVVLMVQGAGRYPGVPGTRLRTEAPLAAAVLFASTLMIFVVPPDAIPAYLTRPHPIIPMLVIIALRFGAWGACVGSTGVAVIAIAGVVRHGGPFEIIPGGMAETVLATQIFIAVAAATAWIVAAMSAERVRTVDELRASRRSLERSQQVAHIGSWEWDIERNTVVWSEEMKRIFGIDPSTVSGDLDAIVAGSIHPDDAASVQAANERVARGGDALDVEYRVVRRDGTVRHVWAVPGDRDVGPDGRVRKLSGIVQDISARHATEERLRAYAETQRVLLSEVNHRVKNNLSAIIGVIHLEEDRAARSGQEDAVRILRQLDLRVRALATTHSLLSAAEWKPVRLDDLCRRILAGSLVAAPAPGGRAAVTDSGVRVDARQAHDLALVMNELATNSTKHSSRPDGVALAIAVDIAAEGDSIRMTYRDDGPGFPAEILRGLPAGGTTGLDLVRGIVTRNLRGTLELENRAGALAIIRFPGFIEGDHHVIA